MGEKVRLHIVVSGRVQGVLYRAGARQRAHELGITGWAHNLIDGKVEIVCEGEQKNTQEFIEWCKQGPPLAKVENIEVADEEYSGEFKDFDIRDFGF